MHLIMQLDWLPNAQFAGLIYAKEHGWYEKAGIELDLQAWNPDITPVDALQKNKNMIISTEDNLLLKGVLEGREMQAFATMMQYSGMGWMSLADKNIRSFKDLKGGRIGVHSDGHTALAVAMQAGGLNKEDVDILEIGYEYEQALIDGYYSAVQCYMPVEPIEYADRGIPVSVLQAKDYGYHVYCQVFAAQTDLIKQEQDALATFLRISFDGWRAAFANPDVAAELIVKHYCSDSKQAVQAKMISAMEPLFYYRNSLAQMGMMHKSRWEESLQLLRHEGLSTCNLCAEQVMTLSVLEKMFAT